MNNDTLLGDVCVLGLGRTGLALASYLADRLGNGVDSVTLYGGARSCEGDETRALACRGVSVVCGTEELRGAYDLAVVSPGIPEGSDFFLSAREHAMEVIGEPEFAWRESPCRWVSITGTNGKTTTTLLTTALLKAGGLEARAVGNVGTAAIGEVATRGEAEWFVAELSSFQLATTSRFHPRVAALLNVTPDHLEWHGSLEAYAQAKARSFQHLDSGDLAVVSEEDGWCHALATQLEARGLRVCRVSVHSEPDGDCAAFVREGRLVVRLDGSEHVLSAVDGMALKGAHNAQNALVAASIALELGVSAEVVDAEVQAFSPLEHRIEPCGTVRGINFVNDSKATNVDAVEKALLAFEPGKAIVLLGGHDKGTELSTLAQAVSARCKAAVCFGEAGPRIADAIGKATVDGGAGVYEAAHMRQALEMALGVAEAGDTILLSPACSSFDEFASYQQRGREFKSLVAGIVSGEGVFR